MNELCPIRDIQRDYWPEYYPSPSTTGWDYQRAEGHGSWRHAYESDNIANFPLSYIDPDFLGSTNINARKKWLFVSVPHDGEFQEGVFRDGVLPAGYGDCSNKCTDDWWVALGWDHHYDFPCKTTCERRDINKVRYGGSGSNYDWAHEQTCGIPKTSDIAYQAGYQRMNPTVCCDDTRQRLEEMEQEWKESFQPSNTNAEEDDIHCNSVSYGKFVSFSLSLF